MVEWVLHLTHMTLTMILTRYYILVIQMPQTIIWSNNTEKIVVIPSILRY